MANAKTQRSENAKKADGVPVEGLSGSPPAAAALAVPQIADEAALEERLSRPTAGLGEELAALGGDLLILGVGGKMGPTLAKMARRALDEVGCKREVLGVARFTLPELREDLERAGIRTIACDLMDREAVQRLPEAANVI